MNTSQQVPYVSERSDSKRKPKFHRLQTQRRREKASWALTLDALVSDFMLARGHGLTYQD